MISAAHAHLWGRYVNKGWILYDDHGGSHQVIQWGNGFGNEGSGHYSLARTTAASADYHTTQALGGYDNRPAYTETPLHHQGTLPWSGEDISRSVGNRPPKRPRRS